MHCPYSTYQRALSAARMSIAKGINNPKLFQDAMLQRLSPKARENPSIILEFMASANEHLQNDFDIMLSFRL
jgi:hypothetical protein